MLVTCPECSAKISDQAEICPHCGLPEPGSISKEYNESIIEKARQEAYISQFVECINPDCGFCDNVTVKQEEIINIELTNVANLEAFVKGEKSFHESPSLEAGYSVRIQIRCPICGSKAYGYII